MEGTIATILFFAGNFAPRGWAFCDGQLLSIAQNTALFALLGTTYGGNGQTTFGLPDLRGRVALHPGQGPGLSQYVLGQSGGSETNTLNATNLPAHTHPLNAVSNAGNTSVPAGAFLSNTGALDREYNNSGTGTVVPMDANAIGTTGVSQPFDILQPYLAINYVICMEGFSQAVINWKIQVIFIVNDIFKQNWWNGLEVQWQQAFKMPVLRHSSEPNPAELDVLYNLQAIRLAGPTAPFPNMQFELTNLSGLERLSKLAIVIITHHKIGNIDVLRELPHLKSLYLFNNSLTSLEGIESLTQLEQLYVQSNQITSIKPIELLVNLKEFYINDNHIDTLDGLSA